MLAIAIRASKKPRILMQKSGLLDSEWLVIKREGVKILKLVLAVQGRSEAAYFEPKKTGSGTNPTP